MTTHPATDQATSTGAAQAVEVVHHVPSGQVPAVINRSSAIEQAADAAIATPGAPGRDEIVALAMTARILSMSGAAPAAVRNNPYVAFHMALMGRDYGMSPTAALQLIDPIGTGDKVRLSLSPQGRVGHIERQRLGRVIVVERENDHAIAMAVGPGGVDRECIKAMNETQRHHLPFEHVAGCSCDVLGYSGFSWEEARMAGLVAPDCQPGAHTPKCSNRNSSPWDRCSQGYVTYPQRMMGWRASGYSSDDHFPGASFGVYSPEELGALVDEDGRAVDLDPAHTVLPEGYEPTPKAPPRPAGDEVIAELRARIGSLPPDREALMADWKDRQVPALNILPAASVALARALITKAEDAAKAAGWDLAAARADYDSNVAAMQTPAAAPTVPAEAAPPPAQPPAAPVEATTPVATDTTAEDDQEAAARAAAHQVAERQAHPAQAAPPAGMGDAAARLTAHFDGLLHPAPETPAAQAPQEQEPDPFDPIVAPIPAAATQAATGPSNITPSGGTGQPAPDLVAMFEAGDFQGISDTLRTLPGPQLAEVMLAHGFNPVDPNAAAPTLDTARKVVGLFYARKMRERNDAQ